MIRCYVTATGEPFTGPPSPVPAMMATNLERARLDLAGACGRFLTGKLPPFVPHPARTTVTP